VNDPYMGFKNKNIGQIAQSPCALPTHPPVGEAMPVSIMWWGAYATGVGVTYPYVGAGGVLGMPRTDGLTAGLTTIQGVRTYDAAGGSWTTPDVFAGDVGDPASQKTYMWNGNNPEAYADPSGYCAAPTNHDIVVCVDAYIQQDNMIFAQGDNRGPAANCASCTYRVEVNLDFTKGTYSISAGTTHYANGAIAGRGSTVGSTAEISGNTAFVHIVATMGGPAAGVAKSLGAQITADFALTVGRNGQVSGGGFHSQFPSWEAYSYRGGNTKTLFTYTEQPRTPFGFALLPLGENRQESFP
jgi:hypothetical protein